MRFPFPSGMVSQYHLHNFLAESKNFTSHSACQSGSRTAFVLAKELGSVPLYNLQGSYLPISSFFRQYLTTGHDSTGIKLVILSPLTPEC